jgi:hypothetical protein
MGALKQIAPNLKKVTTIFNPKTAPYYLLYLDAIEKGASSFTVEPLEFGITSGFDRGAGSSAAGHQAPFAIDADSVAMAVVALGRTMRTQISSMSRKEPKWEGK